MKKGQRGEKSPTSNKKEERLTGLVTLVTGTRGRRCKLLLDGLKEKIGYWKLKDEALDRFLWRTGFWNGLWTCSKTDRRAK